MDAAAHIPQWATDKRTFRLVNVLAGVALCSLIAAVALAEPSVPRAVTNVIFVPTILVAAAIALPVIGLRMLVVRDVDERAVPATRLLVAYVLSALPLALTTLLLGALTALAFVFEVSAASALAQSIVALLGIWVFFSLTVKIVANAQLLLRHWAKA